MDQSDSGSQSKPKRNAGGPIPLAVRDKVKAQFLDIYAKTNNISASAASVGINRRTVQEWRNSGYLTEAEERDAFEQFQDIIAGEVVKFGLYGVQEPLVSNGRYVYDKNGNIVTRIVVDKRLLARLAERYLPGWQRRTEQDITVTHTNTGDIPAQYLLQIDARDLTNDEWATLKTIAAKVQARKDAASTAAIVVVDSDV